MGKDTIEYSNEEESSRTSLASRTHFEVLGLEASSPRKLPCPRLEDRTIIWTAEIKSENPRNLAENLRRPFFVFRERPFFEIAWKTFLKTFFLEYLRLCPWPRNFFVFLALASSLVSTTPPLVQSSDARKGFSKDIRFLAPSVTIGTNVQFCFFCGVFCPGIIVGHF